MAELNGIATLNSLLSQKPQVVRTRIREEFVTIVRPISGPPEFSSNDTFIERREIPEDYSDFARVTSSEIIAVQNLTFDEVNLRALPERPLLGSQLYTNCADGQLSVNISLGVSGTSGYTITKTNGVSTTIQGSVQVSYNSTYGTYSTMLSANRSVSSSTSIAESKSDTETRTISANLTVGPKKHGRVELLAFETTVEVPFHATLVLDGDLEPNKSGFTKASQMLTAEERTVPFSGELRITGVSAGRTRTTELPGSPNCDGQEAGLRTLQSSRQLAPGSISPEYLTQFHDMSELAFEGHTLRTAATSSPSFTAATSSRSSVAVQGDTIGPADGISYQVISSSVIMRMTPACGFNDIGLPNGGNFLVEIRQYTQYQNGVLIAQWSSTEETFQGCVPV